MSPRDEILAELSRRPIPPVELPSLDGEWQSFDDLMSRFCEVLRSVGGDAITVSEVSAIDRELEKLPTYASADRIVSLVPGVAAGSVDLQTIERPHDLENVDFAILPAQFGVAENAAVWLDLRDVRHRVICVLSQHLAVVVSAKEIVPTMHEAYRRLADPGSNGDSFVARPGYGLFLSGPSKTADIEQSLVIGAHGARSLTVFLTD